jgi:hypothetical protein
MQQELANQMDWIAVQAQDLDGSWITHTRTQNIPPLVREAMEQLRWQFPDRRIRAVDANGRLVDML